MGEVITCEDCLILLCKGSKYTRLGIITAPEHSSVIKKKKAQVQSTGREVHLTGGDKDDPPPQYSSFLLP